MYIYIYIYMYIYIYIYIYIYYIINIYTPLFVELDPEKWGRDSSTPRRFSAGQRFLRPETKGDRGRMRLQRNNDKLNIFIYTNNKQLCL